jgi:hypothetical protein
MAQKLSEQRIEEMFAAYCEQQSVRYVAEKCHVQRATVRRYRDNRGWDGRLNNVRNKAEEKIDDTIAARKARELKIIDNALANYVKALNSTVTVSAVCKCGKTVTITLPGMKAKLSDIESLIRTRCLVTGDPTERAESTVEQPRLIKYCLPVPPELLAGLPTAPPPEKPQNRAQNGT